MVKTSLFYEVVPGLLFAGGCPWEQSTENGLFLALMSLGIRDFMTLRDDFEIDDVQASVHSSYPNISIQQFPISDFSVPDAQSLHRILHTMVEHIACGKQIYVGCAKGLGRTGLIIACFLSLHHGISGRDGLKLMNELRMQGNFQIDSASPETSEQVEYIMKFQNTAYAKLD